MFVLRVTYLLGRVYSAVFEGGDDKSEVEWPPHPSRLFSALVAAWGEGGAEEELRPVLDWFETQPAPAIYAGTCTQRKLVQAFVPVNDARTVPEDRPRKGRTFPSGALSRPDVYFVWKSSPPRELLAALEGLLQRTCSLGHSSSMVAVEVADSVPGDGWTVWEPGAAEGLRMRIAYPGRLNDLMDRYKRFQEDPNKIHRPPLGKTTLYAAPAEAAAIVPGGVFDRMIILRRDDGARCSLRSTLPVVAALRGAILKLAPQPVPEYLSGHSGGSTDGAPARSERPHLSLAPLAFVDSPHATGDLLGVALVLPKTLSRDELAVCWDVTGRIERLTMGWGSWSVSMADAEERRRTLRPGMWTRPSRLWSTVTPFVFDRYPKEPYGAEAERVVREAFVRAGFPEPCELDLHYNPWHLGVPKASAFPPMAAKPGKPQRYHCHVRARFEGLVRGPMVTGAGRYYGYGLFAPLPSRGGTP